MEKELKKIQWLSIGLLTLAVVVLSGLFVYLSLEKKTQTKASKPTIALVNEDEPSSFNKKDYNFGKDFVNLASGDSKYNWQVVSRAVADRAYTDKSVDAVIYIPQSFSHDILTLQDLNPIQSQVNYKLQDQQTELSQNLLDDKISDILHDFNQDIVKMYYASVAENISDAQNNMNAVVENQGNVLKQLSTQVYGPFQSTNQGYSSVIMSADGLKAENSAWIDSQNAFTKSTQSMLDSTSKTFQSQLPDLKEYFDTQKKIAETNVKNGNQGISNQAKEDQEVYFEQFNNAYNNTLGGLTQFYKEDEATSTGLLTNLKYQVQDYNTTITAVHDDLATQIESLTEDRDNLLNLENDLYKQFFAQENPGIDNSNFDQMEGTYQNEANARQALAEKINDSFGITDNFSATAYMDQLKSLLSQISWESSDYKPLFDSIAAADPNADISKYEKELDLISRYGKVLPGASSGSVAFTDAPNTSNTNQTFSKTLNIIVPAGKNYVLNHTESINAEVFYNGSSVDQADAEIIDKGGNGLELHNKNHEDGSGNVVDNTLPAHFTIIYEVSLHEMTNPTVTFGWGEKSTNENSSTSDYQLFPENQIKAYLGGDNFGDIAQLLSTIEHTANLISWIYGHPNDTVDSVLGRLPALPELQDFYSLADDSIYKLYGNMDLTQLQMSDRISEEDIKAYQEEGHNNIEKVIQSIRALNKSIDSLTKDRDTLAQAMPNDVFTKNINDLQEWYSSTLTSVDRTYKSWKENGEGTLALKSWQEYTPDDKALYEDKASSENLYTTISELSTSTAKSAEDTAKSAQMIKDNANGFKQMVETTQETKASAENLLKSTDNMLNDGNNSLEVSQDYNNNFGKVLENTRDQKSDREHIFNFFAQPLSVKNVTKTFSSIQSSIDWRWPLLFGVGLLLGVLVTLLSQIIVKKKRG